MSNSKIQNLKYYLLFFYSLILSSASSQSIFLSETESNTLGGKILATLLTKDNKKTKIEFAKEHSKTIDLLKLNKQLCGFFEPFGEVSNNVSIKWQQRTKNTSGKNYEFITFYCDSLYGAYPPTSMEVELKKKKKDKTFYCSSFFATITDTINNPYDSLCIPLLKLIINDKEEDLYNQIMDSYTGKLTKKEKEMLPYFKLMLIGMMESIDNDKPIVFSNFTSQQNNMVITSYVSYKSMDTNGKIIFIKFMIENNKVVKLSVNTHI